MSNFFDKQFILYGVNSFQLFINMKNKLWEISASPYIYTDSGRFFIYFFWHKVAWTRYIPYKDKVTASCMYTW